MVAPKKRVQYYLYVIGSTPRIEIPFESPDDELAIETAMRRAGGLAFELWCENRLVKRWQGSEPGKSD
jgi:hypothetical protein